MRRIPQAQTDLARLVDKILVTMPTKNESLARALYANHRQFLRTHRGALRQHDGYDAIHGDVAAFRISLLHDATAVEAAAATSNYVYAPPWAPVNSANPALAGMSHQLAHMSLGDDAFAGVTPVADCAVEIVDTEAGLRDFTFVQAAAFAEGQQDRQSLQTWLWGKNLGALHELNQRFYVLKHSGEPASVLLTVDSGDALGIYAVATLPTLQRRGLSRYLLAHICSSSQMGATPVCLQVLRGSDAERLYRRLGFVENFVVEVHKSNAHT